jgi:23S rRNA (guanosine2251-2'-O)-methyltransferase
MASKGKRPGTAKGKKGPTVGSGGQRRKALEGKGPTPKAEDRKGHKAFKGNKPEKAVARKGEFLAPTARTAGTAGARRTNAKGMSKAADSGEVLSGRNSVLEALRAKVPATALYISNRIEMDERTKETIQLANARQIPINEITKPEIDRLTGFDAVHQGIALSVPAYQYQHPVDLLDKVLSRGQNPLFVALDGITDPRNLGAIIRSVAAFGGHGVILPQRRSTGVTASAWKTSAGAAARTPVALAANLTATIKEFKKKGVFVVGLDGDGDMNLQNFTLGREPLLIVVGSEGKGLSRLVTENCDAIVSIPISSATESLNAGIAASVTLYEVSKLRAKN